jgi:site-specific recombinase XerD
LKSLLKYLNNYYSEWLDYRRIELKRVKSDYVDSITDAERNIFFNFIWTYEKYRINALRMQLLCNVGYTSGLRLSEALALTVNQIRNWECRITGKWNKTRRVFFSNSTKELLEDYLEEREKPIPRTWITWEESDFVFISHNAGYDYWKPIKKNTACEIIKKYSDELNIWKRITMHSLRHSYATKLLESWMNIREIQELLGHKDIQTTEGYCHVLKSNLKDKVMQVFT